MAIKYFYSSAQQASRSVGPFKELKRLPDNKAHTLFKFDQDFIKNLQSIKPLELAQSVPFISLSSVGLDGKEIENFNKKFFHAQLGFSKPDQSVRFSERPSLSLIDVTLRTASESGYLYTTEVMINLKVHRPDTVANGSLISLLFPGMPFLLEYGWNSPNEFLNIKEKLQFALRTYEITFTEDGQAELMLDGTAFNEKFNNVYIGDDGTEPQDEKKKLSVTSKNTLSSHLNRMNNYIGYIKNVVENKETDKNTAKRDYKVISSLLESYQTSLQRTQGKIRENFKNQLKVLADIGKQPGDNLSSLYGKKFKIKKFKNGFATFHDIVSILCNSTFNAMEGKVFPVQSNYMLIYGQLDKASGTKNSVFGGTSIADFPIDYKMFIDTLQREFTDNGQQVLTISALLNVLVRDFLGSQEYWAKLEGTDSGIRLPYPVVNFSNNSDDMSINILDANNDIPVTSGIIKEIAKEKSATTQDDFEKRALKDYSGIPVIRVGHANSFIKTLKLSQITDEQIKGVLISRMAENAVIDNSEFIPPELETQVSETDTPLQLPLQGEMACLGHTSWKPFKVLYLSTGLVISDGVYKILSVTNKIGIEGFSTTLEFIYN